MEGAWGPMVTPTHRDLAWLEAARAQADFSPVISLMERPTGGSVISFPCRWQLLALRRLVLAAVGRCSAGVDGESTRRLGALRLLRP